MNSLKMTSIAMATAAASMFATVAVNVAFADDTATVKCDHATSCAGKGACKTANNACKGKNSCKGAGFTMEKSSADCAAAQAAVAKKS